MTHTTENETRGWDYVPWNGVHEFAPWTVMHRADGSRWLAPGCSCGTIRSGGAPDETEASMRAWHDNHLARVSPPTPSPAPTNPEEER